MIDHCNELSSHPSIVAEENKRKFIIRNPEGYRVNMVTVDGCYIQDGLRCDYLFEIMKPADRDCVHYVELKGSDISHAIHQLEATIRYCRLQHSILEKSSYIVASKVPKATPKTQILKKAFKRKNNMLLHIDTRQKTISI